LSNDLGYHKKKAQNLLAKVEDCFHKASIDMTGSREAEEIDEQICTVFSVSILAMGANLKVNENRILNLRTSCSNKLE